MKPVGVEVVPREDPPNENHYQSPTGPTAALSGSKRVGQPQDQIKISSVTGRKRKAHSIETPSPKRSKSEGESSASSSTSSDSSTSGEVITPFDPASLVKNKEGTFTGMTKFMRKRNVYQRKSEKHFSRNILA